MDDTKSKWWWAGKNEEERWLYSQNGGLMMVPRGFSPPDDVAALIADAPDMLELLRNLEYADRDHCAICGQAEGRGHLAPNVCGLGALLAKHGRRP